jgi:hypothetical protein
MLSAIARDRNGMDLFTVIQRLPATAPDYPYPMEWDNVAAIPLSTFDDWWTRQIGAKTRNMVRRAEKSGLVLREVEFNDALLRGIWEIYNECPVRQGRPFPHYGKDIDTVGRLSSTFLDSSVFIGAFLGDKLVAFVKLTIDEKRTQAALMNILSLIEHRDKAPTNALIAESVKACVTRAIPYLVYSKFSYGRKQIDTLRDFKQRNGFRQLDIPRYYVPLTRTGRIAFQLGLQHGVRGRVPEPIVSVLRRCRQMWHGRTGLAS